MNAFSDYYTKEELYYLFSIETLQKMYQHYVDRMVKVNIAEKTTLTSLLHNRVPRWALKQQAINIGDLVEDLVKNTYRVKDFVKSPKGIVPVVYSLADDSLFTFDSFLIKIPPIGVSELLPLDLRMQLFALGRSKNFFAINGRIRVAGDIYVLTEEDAHLILNSDSARREEVLIIMLDD